ncbi:uncharacterized protein LOC126264585 isoform X2 [Aethina tumida]|nr:uncharacterized protein LOC126264585 isoform X2 [Aethina tumida]
MGPVSKLLFCFLFVMPNIKAFTVDIVNITTCKNSDDELGTLDTDIESEEAPDQLFNADFNLPMDLDKDTMVEYESNAWSKGKWKFLFKG